MGFSTAPIEQICWFERCENSPCLNHQPINSVGFEGAIRNPIQQEEVVGRALRGPVCSVPFARFIFDMWDNNPAYDLTVLCEQLMIDNHGIQGRLW